MLRLTNTNKNARSELSTTEMIKSCVLWLMTPCRLVHRYERSTVREEVYREGGTTGSFETPLGLPTQRHQNIKVL